MTEAHDKNMREALDLVNKTPELAEWETFDNKMTKFYWVDSLELNGDLALNIVDGSSDFSCIPTNGKGKVELEIGELRDIIQYTRKAALSSHEEKVRADWLRSEIETLEGMKDVRGDMEELGGGGWYKAYNQALTTIITRYKEELKALESK